MIVDSEHDGEKERTESEDEKEYPEVEIPKIWNTSDEEEIGHNDKINSPVQQLV